MRPWIALAAFLFFAGAAKSDTLPITFAGANPGDGGTITTDGCAICTASDITGFRQTAAQFPLLHLFDDGTWSFIASDQYV